MKARVGVGLALVLLAGASGCGGEAAEMPRCRGDQRLAIVAQSVPAASYVPCVATLPAGWRFDSLAVSDRGTRFVLDSDRADHPSEVRLTASCDVASATPVPPRDEGVRTYVRLDSIAPRYRGQMFDVFPGGCVTYDFDFVRGRHIGLMDELGQAVGLYPRRQLRQELHDGFGVNLDP